MSVIGNLESKEKSSPVLAFGQDFEPCYDMRCANNDLLAKKSLHGYKLCPENKPMINFFKCNGVVIWYNKKRNEQLIPKICDSNLTIGKYISHCIGNPPLSAPCIDVFHFIALKKKDTYYNAAEIDYVELQTELYRIIRSVGNYDVYKEKYEYLQYMEPWRPPWYQ